MTCLRHKVRLVAANRHNAGQVAGERSTAQQCHIGVLTTNQGWRQIITTFELTCFPLIAGEQAARGLLARGADEGSAWRPQ